MVDSPPRGRSPRSPAQARLAALEGDLYCLLCFPEGLQRGSTSANAPTHETEQPNIAKPHESRVVYNNQHGEPIIIMYRFNAVWLLYQCAAFRLAKYCLHYISGRDK